MKATVESRESFTANYYSYLFYYMLRSLCYCLEKWCRRSAFCDRRITKYDKLERALERLDKEQDVVRLLRQNRVTNLLSKLSSSSNQRDAVNHASKFVIHDAQRPRRDLNPPRKERSFDSAKILEKFKPESSVLDRRILYEITQILLDKDEFKD